MRRLESRRRSPRTTEQSPTHCQQWRSSRWSTKGRLRIRSCSRGRPHPPRLRRSSPGRKSSHCHQIHSTSHPMVQDSWNRRPSGHDRQRLLLPKPPPRRHPQANGVTHVRIPPRRPQINGKVERFNRTLLDEWAYVRVYTSEQQRIDALADWIHTYNHYRNHTAIGGPPISRATNVAAQHT